MRMPTQAQINTLIRYASGYLATGGAIFVAAGALPPDTVHSIVDAAQKVLDDIKQLIGDSYLLVALVFPLVMAAAAKIGWTSASPKNQIAAVQSLPTAQVIVSDPKLAEGIPGVKVGAVPPQ